MHMLLGYMLVMLKNTLTITSVCIKVSWGPTDHFYARITESLRSRLDERRCLLCNIMLPMRSTIFSRTASVCGVCSGSTTFLHSHQLSCTCLSQMIVVNTGKHVTHVYLATHHTICQLPSIESSFIVSSSNSALSRVELICS